MAREELSWPAGGRVVADDCVDVGERGDVRLVLPGGDQQRLLSIFDGAREGGQVGEYSRGIVSCPLLLITGISPSYPSSRQTITTLQARNRAADALAGNPVGVESVVGYVEAAGKLGLDLGSFCGLGRIEVWEPGLRIYVPLIKVVWPRRPLPELTVLYVCVFQKPIICFRVMLSGNL